jgi:peptidoglycan/LPS O-acetylase OafA/YrhL
VLYWNLFKIEQMAVGALGAFYLYHKKPVVLQFFYHPVTMVATLLLFLSLFVTDLEYAGSTLFEALIFLLFIVNVSTNNKFPIQLRQSVFTTLGNISYGIYMYHTIIIAILINMLQKTVIDDMPLAFDIALYTLSVAFTILISYLSYKYFETPFLKFKEKFMVVKSSGSGPKTAELSIPVEEGMEARKSVIGN